MAKFRGILHFDIERCKGCNLCVDACPKNCLALDSNYVNAKGYNPVSEAVKDTCVACGNCTMICPDVCITLEKEEVTDGN